MNSMQSIRLPEAAGMKSVWGSPLQSGGGDDGEGLGCGGRCQSCYFIIRFSKHWKNRIKEKVSGTFYPHGNNRVSEER